MKTTPNTTDTPVLWTIEDIAAFYQRSVSQARRLVRMHGFPRPARGDRFRWVAAHVIAFALDSPEEDAASDADVLGPVNTKSERVVRRGREKRAA